MRQFTKQWRHEIWMRILLFESFLANGAMGYALERWHLTSWCVYILLVWVGEAWMIGRWLGLTWTASLFRSFLANAVTGFFCAGSGLFAAGLHEPLVGSKVSPIPFLDTLVMLLVWVIPTVLIEFWFWPQWAMPSSLKSFWRVTWVHLLSVPMALAIILISPNPFPGAYSLSVTWTNLFRNNFARIARDYTATSGHFPGGHSPGDIIRETFRNNSEKDDDKLGNPELFNQVEYPRISFSSVRTIPYEVNPDVAGKPIRYLPENVEAPDEWVWFMRPKIPRERDFTFWVNMFTGEVKYSR